ncbi:unnamed protein product [Amoebophrya sp. A120]|nr:unnamed protein product [Amoebophrya sp. A120]|eukprot:GSA120T00010945001.1
MSAIPSNVSYYCGGKQYSCGFYKRPVSAQRPSTATSRGVSARRSRQKPAAKQVEIKTGVGAPARKEGQGEDEEVHLTPPTEENKVHSRRPISANRAVPAQTEVTIGSDSRVLQRKPHLLLARPSSAVVPPSASASTGKAVMASIAENRPQSAAVARPKSAAAARPQSGAVARPGSAVGGTSSSRPGSASTSSGPQGSSDQRAGGAVSTHGGGVIVSAPSSAGPPSSRPGSAFNRSVCNALMTQPSLATYGANERILCVPRPVSAAYPRDEQENASGGCTEPANSGSSHPPSSGPAAAMFYPETSGSNVNSKTTSTGSHQNYGMRPLGELAADHVYREAMSRKNREKRAEEEKRDAERKKKALELRERTTSSGTGTGAGTATGGAGDQQNVDIENQDPKSGSFAPAPTKPKGGAGGGRPAPAELASMDEVIFKQELPGYMKGRRVVNNPNKKSRAEQVTAYNKFVYRNDRQTQCQSGAATGPQMMTGQQGKEEGGQHTRHQNHEAGETNDDDAEVDAGTFWAGNVLTWTSKKLRPYSGKMAAQNSSSIAEENKIGDDTKPMEVEQPEHVLAANNSSASSLNIANKTTNWNYEPAEFLQHHPPRNLTGTFHRRNLVFFVKNKPAVPRPYSVKRVADRMEAASAPATNATSSGGPSNRPEPTNIHTVVPPKNSSLAAALIRGGESKQRHLQDLKHILEADDLTLEGDEIVYREGELSP